MSKTQDVLSSIWSDPWFHGLSATASYLYLWCLTNDHAHLSGLYMVARETMAHETKLDEKRITAALGQLQDKVVYKPTSGVVWVRGRAKNVRCKTPQVAKSIASAVLRCPEVEVQSAFLDKYGDEAWLREVLAPISQKFEVHPNLTEVPSQRQGQRHSSFEGKATVRTLRDVSVPSRARPHKADQRVAELEELRQRFVEEDIA